MPRFLVTAGNTRERIDAVRDWGNVFTGNTGLAIARALLNLGHVDLLTSNRQHLAELAADADGLRRIQGAVFTSHADLRAALGERMTGGDADGLPYDGVFMTAAVADYRPGGAFEVISRQAAPDGTEQWIVRDAQAGKVQGSFDEIAFLGRRTEKLVDLFRNEWRHRGLLVKFKLEVGIDSARLIEIGRESRVASGADYLVANTLDMVDGPAAGAYLIGPDDAAEFVPRGDLPGRMAGLAELASSR